MIHRVEFFLVTLCRFENLYIKNGIIRINVFIFDVKNKFYSVHKNTQLLK